MQHDQLNVEMSLNYTSPQLDIAGRCSIEVDANQFRFEVLPENSPTLTILLTNDEYSRYEATPSGDFSIHSRKQAINRLGDILFDPRMLGLSDLMHFSTPISKCLWRNDRANLELIGQERINDVTAWHVKATKPSGSTSEYWIEEPGFRVHKRTVRTAGGTRISIKSDFAGSDSESPFPSHVTAVSTLSNGDTTKREYDIEQFSLDPTIESRRFTASSLNLPINTMANDYRTRRIVGYWDGKAFSDNPVAFGRGPMITSSVSSWKQSLFFALNALVALVISVYLFRRRTDF